MSKFTKSKKLYIALLIFVLILIAVALIIFKSIGDEKENESKGLIGFTGYNLSLDFFSSMEKGIRYQAEKMNYDYIAFDQESDETKLIASFKELIRRDADAIIVSPINPDVLAPLVEQAHAKNIPVIINDIGGGQSNYDAIVVSDNWQGGQLAADYLAEHLNKDAGSHKVAILACEPTAIYAARRGEAFRQYIEERGYEVVSEKTAYSRQEDGYVKMKEILEEQPDIQAVFAENDLMAVGAANALAELKRQDIVLIGFDGAQAAIDAIKTGQMQATVMQNPDEMGRLTAKIADQILTEKPINYSDSEKREIYVNVSLFTAEDIALFIEETQ